MGEGNARLCRMLAAMEAGELLVLQARLPGDREALEFLWRDDLWKDEERPDVLPPMLGPRMRAIFSDRKSMTIERFCTLMNMTPQNWSKLASGKNRTTNRINIWRFAVLMGLDRWETCDLLRLDGELNMECWDARDKAVWGCLSGGALTPAKVEAALHAQSLPPLYTAEAREQLGIPIE